MIEFSFEVTVEGKTRIMRVWCNSLEEALEKLHELFPEMNIKFLNYNKN